MPGVMEKDEFQYRGLPILQALCHSWTLAILTQRKKSITFESISVRKENHRLRNSSRKTSQ